MFWQEFFDSYAHLSSIWLIHSSIYSLSHHAELFIGCLFTMGGFLMIIPQFVFNKLLQKR